MVTPAIQHVRTNAVTGRNALNMTISRILFAERELWQGDALLLFGNYPVTGDRQRRLVS